MAKCRIGSASALAYWMIFPLVIHTFAYKKQIALQSFLGYDYVVVPGSLGESLGFLRIDLGTADTAALQRSWRALLRQ